MTQMFTDEGEDREGQGIVSWPGPHLWKSCSSSVDELSVLSNPPRRVSWRRSHETPLPIQAFAKDARSCLPATPRVSPAYQQRARAKINVVERIMACDGRVRN